MHIHNTNTMNADTLVKRQIQTSVKDVIHKLQKQDKHFFISDLLDGYINNTFTVTHVDDERMANHPQKSYNQLLEKYGFLGYSTAPCIPESVLKACNVKYYGSRSTKFRPWTNSETPCESKPLMYTFNKASINVNVKEDGFEKQIKAIFDEGEKYYNDRLEIGQVNWIQALRRASGDDTATSNTGKIDYGLFAKQDLERGTIFVYSGIIIAASCANIYGTYNMEKYELSEYSWDCSSDSMFDNNYTVDGLLVRNHLCFANHRLGEGQNMKIYTPPQYSNADTVKINNVPVVVYVVTKDVKKGTEMCLSYGPSYFDQQRDAKKTQLRFEKLSLEIMKQRRVMEETIRNHQAETAARTSNVLKLWGLWIVVDMAYFIFILWICLTK